MERSNSFQQNLDQCCRFSAHRSKSERAVLSHTPVGVRPSQSGERWRNIKGVSGLQEEIQDESHNPNLGFHSCQEKAYMSLHFAQNCMSVKV